MPILHKLVAVCEGPMESRAPVCGKRQEYEAIVNHTGEAASDSYGSRDLSARDVEHEPELPEGFSYVRSASGWGTKLLCRECQEKHNA